MAKTIKEKIEKLEVEGWEYDDKFTMPTGKGSTLVQMMALKKGNEYRRIENGKILVAKPIMSEEDYNDMQEAEKAWGGKRSGAGRPSTGRSKKIIYVTDEEYTEVKKLIDKLRE